MKSLCGFTLENVKENEWLFQQKKAEIVILFFILQYPKNIVLLGLEKLFMKVGYYDTE